MDWWRHWAIGVWVDLVICVAGLGLLFMGIEDHRWQSVVLGAADLVIGCLYLQRDYADLSDGED